MTDISAIQATLVNVEAQVRVASYHPVYCNVRVADNPPAGPVNTTALLGSNSLILPL
jgi:hypothetical protein